MSRAARAAPGVTMRTGDLGQDGRAARLRGQQCRDGRGGGGRRQAGTPEGGNLRRRQAGTAPGRTMPGVARDMHSGQNWQSGIWWGAPAASCRPTARRRGR